MKVTDLEKANDLLRRIVDWETSNTSNLIDILVDAKAYLATQPEPVDPDLIAAREIATGQSKIGNDYTRGTCDQTYAVRVALAGIKHGRGK